MVTQPEEDGMAIRLFLLLGKRFGERSMFNTAKTRKSSMPYAKHVQGDYVKDLMKSWRHPHSNWRLESLLETEKSKIQTPFSHSYSKFTGIKKSETKKPGLLIYIRYLCIEILESNKIKNLCSNRVHSTLLSRQYSCRQHQE